MEINKELLQSSEMMEDLQLYISILNGEATRFPIGFWDKYNILDTAATFTRYLFEDVLKLDEDGIKKVNYKVFSDNKLKSMITLVFDGCYSKAIHNAYPNRFKPWELGQIPKGFWDNQHNIKSAVRWIVEVKLDNNEDRVYEELNRALLEQYKMQDLATNIAEALDMVYPNRFKPWKFKCNPKNYFDNDDNLKRAIKWVVENILESKDSRVENEFTAELLIEEGIRIKRRTVQEVLDLVYPGQYNIN